ncbi:transmembrane channel-like protein 6 isoform X2 [Protopterus annectens]|nr:transmembrane channel-like protein 6 isoform X2 [Protopterus annectens]
MKLLKAELQKLSWSQQGHLLQQQPLSLYEKQDLRSKDSAHRNQIRKANCKCEIPCCTRLKYSILRCLRHTSYELISFGRSLYIWHYSFKQIGGRFGSSVLSYFMFLRTLLHFSAFLFLVNVLFIVIPHAVYPPRVNNNSSFTGLELLTGAGYFTNTVLFYGYYTNSTVNNVNTTSSSQSLPSTTLHLPYNMPLAYVFTVGVSFFLTCIILVYSMSKSFGRVFRVGGNYKDLATMVFCCWDFKVIQKRSVVLQHENISTQLKEILGEMLQKAPKLTILQKCRKLTVLFLTWGLCLGSVTGCVAAVYYLSYYLHKERHQVQSEAKLLILPLMVSVINLVLPYLYNLLEIAERQDSPALQVYIAISRNLLLKMMMLGMLCYHWLAQVSKSNIQCWETFVGQEFYRFIIMDFIFALLDTLFGEFVWRHMSQKWLDRERKPEFDIARNVLELIYGQTLTWLGVLFSPLLPVVQMIKLFLLFYIKKTSLMMNCKSPSKPWCACHMSTVFITLLCFPSFLGAAVATTYSIWSIKPSMECGPFRNLSTMYESGKIWVENLEKDNPRFAWFAWIHKYLVENPVFLFMIAGILLIAIYFHMQVVDGQRKIIKLLRDQIANEGEDKKFLINRLQTIYCRKKKKERKTIKFSTE